MELKSSHEILTQQILLLLPQMKKLHVARFSSLSDVTSRQYMYCKTALPKVAKGHHGHRISRYAPQSSQGHLQLGPVPGVAKT